MHHHVPHNDFLIIQKANKLFPNLHFPLFHVVLVAFKCILTFFFFPFFNSSLPSPGNSAWFSPFVEVWDAEIAVSLGRAARF